jgi:fused signal recognition particle receptor
MDPIVVIAILLVIFASLATVVIFGRRGRGGVVEPPQQATSTQAQTDLEPGVDYAPGVNDDATPPTMTPRRTIDDVALPEPVAEVVEQAAEPVEPVEGRFARLRSRVRSGFGRSIADILRRGGLDQAAWDEVEESLLLADVGLDATQELVTALKRNVRGENATEVLRSELTAMVDGGFDRSLALSGTPAVVLVVGVNGTGKTTTTGKIARMLVASGKTVVLAAADTFRAAAADQLATWGERVGAQVVRGPENGDPAAVAFDAVKRGIDSGADVVLIDTAGRLHTKTGLMDELGKVKRVVEKAAPVTEVLLVLDATTGQNGLTQARVFGEVVDVSGVVLSKLDGSARGGIVISVQRTLGVPVKLVGLGEGPDDLAPFDPALFVDALLDVTQK